MKKNLLLLVCATLLSTTAIAERNVPKYDGPIAEWRGGETLYLLHKATQKFYSYGNDWGTHVSLSERGIPLAFHPTEEINEDENPIYEIRDFHPEKNNWYYAFLTFDPKENKTQEVYHLYTDGAASRLDRYFCVEQTEDKAFRIYCAETNDTLRHTEGFADYYLTLDPEYVDEYHEGVFTGTGIVYASASKLPQNEWLTVLEEDYKAYEEQLRIYDRAQELLGLIQEAEELGIENLEDAHAAYDNLDLTYDQLSEAIAQVLQLFSQYYQETVTPTNPIDMTRYIQNPDFEESIDGWMNEQNISTFEQYDVVSHNWADVVDGTCFTGRCYLNLWNGSALSGPIATQTLTDLPNGVYEVTIAAFSESEGGYVFAGDVKTPITTGKISDTQYGRDYVITTLVTDGTLSMGYGSQHTGSFWSAMDNVRLLYFGAGEDAYAAWVEKSIEQAPSFDGIRCQAEIVNSYKQALEELQSANLDETLMTYVQAYLEALNAVNANVAAYDRLEDAIASANEQKYEFWDFYINQIEQYITTIAQPALDAVELDTDGVEAICSQLLSLVNEGNASFDLLMKLIDLHDYLKVCIDTYANTSSTEAMEIATKLYEEVGTMIATESMENNEQVRTTMQQIEDAIHDLRIPTGEASDDNPMDYTVYITNPSFEEGTTGWENSQIDTFEAANSWSEGVSAMSNHGSAYLNLWDATPNGCKASQTIIGLPNGTYTLGVTAYSTIENSTFVFANGDNVAVDAADNLPGNAKQYEITTRVTEGTLTIGVIIYSENAVWCTFDDFTLTSYGSNSTRETSGDAYSQFAPDGIDAVKAKTVNYGIYNLSGQRLQQLQKGINIVNGRKILVK